MTARTAALALAKAAKEPGPTTASKRPSKKTSKRRPATEVSDDLVASDVPSQNEHVTSKSHTTVGRGGRLAPVDVGSSDSDLDSEEELDKEGGSAFIQARSENDPMADESAGSSQESDSDEDQPKRMAKSKHPRSKPEGEMDEDDYEFKPWRNGHAPPKKKKKKSLVARPSIDSATPAKKKAELEAFKALPIELLCEIFSHLHPLDVLRLARTSKQWRRLLMSRDSTWIWNRVLAALPCDFPACPSSLSHPEYVSLVFEFGCQLCGSPWVTTTFYDIHIRLCKDCAKLKIIHEKRCAPLLGEVDSRVTALIPYTHDIPGSRGGRILHRGFYLPDIRWVDSRLEELEAAVYAHEKGAKKALEVFIAERIAVVAEVAQNAEDMVRWEDRHEQFKEDELKRKRLCRKEAIAARLCELGCERSAFFDKDWFKQHHQLRMPKLLSGHEWEEIRPWMQAFVEDHIADDVATHLEEIRRPRRETLHELYSELCIFPARILNIVSFGCLLTVQYAVNSSRDLDRLLSDGGLLDNISTEVSDLHSHRLRCLVAKAASTNKEGVTIEDLSSDDTQVLEEMLDAVEGGFRYLGSDGRTCFLRPKMALDELTDVFMELSKRFDVGDKIPYRLFETSLPDKITTLCDSSFSYYSGDARFLTSLGERHGVDRVRKAIAGKDDLGDDRFACPACPNRPKRQLANLMAHISHAHKYKDVLRDADIDTLQNGTMSTVAQQHEAAQLAKRQTMTAAPDVDLKAKHQFIPDDHDVVWV